MNLNDQQYERINAFLDGENVELTAPEREVADQIMRDEAAIGGLLDVNVSSDAINNARRRMLHKLHRPPVLKFGWYVAAVTSSAAAILIVASVFFTHAPAPRQQASGIGNVTAESWQDIVENTVPMRQDSLKLQVDDLEKTIIGSAAMTDKNTTTDESELLVEPEGSVDNQNSSAPTLKAPTWSSESA